MAASAELRNRLESLSITRAQRPKIRGRSGTWRVVRLLFLLTVLCGVAYAAYLAYQRGAGAAIASLLAPSDREPKVALYTVAERVEPPPAPVHAATGKIVSDHRVQVATKVSGQIVALFFEQGDRVAEGQTLARIEDVQYRARRDEAAALLEKARANLAFQKFNHQRLEALQASSQSTELEMAEARRARDEAIAQVAADEARLADAEKALRDCEVTAPIAGVILERNVEVGDFVAAEGGRGANANAQFGAIADMQKLRVEVDISELDVARIRDEMPCVITPDAYKDRRYPGSVLWIDPGANYSKATVQVKVRIDHPDEFLRVEGSGQVAFYGEDPATAAQTVGPNGVWLPIGAVLERESATPAVLRIVRDPQNRTLGLLERVPVTLGRKRGDSVELLDGLQIGDPIVSGGLDKLQPGQRVRIE